MINQMVSSDLTQTVISHLGGENILTRIGAGGFFTQKGRISFRLSHANPKKVHSVVISTEPHGYFRMDCYGEVRPGTLSAPLVGSAHAIIPENLATVLGQLTGIESIHHRHF